MSTSCDIRVRRGEPNDAICIEFRDKLLNHINSLPEAKLLKGPTSGDEDSGRPMDLPEGSIFLYAEASPDATPVGSACVVPLRAGSPSFAGLPRSQELVGEVKRMIVLPEYRRFGVAARLLEELERIAKEKMGLKLLVVETLFALKTAQALYESKGYLKRDVWGRYVQEESCCFEKWL
jgi:GNAT superfamily N-acetyltransferase